MWRIDENRPIWVQLTEQLTEQIIAGRYEPGERMPSVRDLAAEAGVNPNTMQRAMAELEAMGLGIPKVTAVFQRLRQLGLEIDPSVYTMEEAVQALLTLKGGRDKC